MQSDFRQKLVQRWLPAFAALYTFWMLGAGSASGQVFQLTGGSSSMLNAHGGSLEVQSDTYAARFDLGFFGSPSLGFFYQRPYRDSLLGAGDQQIPFLLPTDLFDRSFYTIGRGVSLLRKTKHSRLFVFAGATATGLTSPFLSVAHPDMVSGILFYEQQLSPSLRFFSRDVVSRRQTSIQAIEWKARDDIKMALSAGVGNNEGYWSSSLSLDKQWVSVDATYADAGASFERVLVASPQLAENDRENIRVQFAPLSSLRVVVSRNNYLSATDSNGVERATVNGFGVWTSLATVQLYGSLFQSSVGSEKSSAMALGTRRQITRRLETGISYLRSANAHGQSSHSVVGNVREILSSRLSFNQEITHEYGQTNVAFGGSFLSNFMTVSVDYQTVFLPFLQDTPSQFRQVVSIGLHFQLPHGLQLNAETNVNPLGKIGYTSYMSTYAYRGMQQASPGVSAAGNFFRNIVRGRVLDTQGDPVAGAALLIGSDLVFSDSDGHFLLRLKSEKSLNLSVSLEDFTAPGQYAVVSAPSVVKTTREDDTSEYEIVVKRVPVPVPTQHTQSIAGNPVPN